MEEHLKHQHNHWHHHHGEVSHQSVHNLWISFIVNMLLSVAELVGGLVAGSIALIGDALHNTSDAFSILIALLAFKIGYRKADKHYTYGFKRAEIIGGFVNLILLFVSGLYLLAEGVMRLIKPEPVSGELIIWISILALIIDVVTAKISHHDSKHNMNMRMVFLHNLADALGSIGVIVSGLCIMWFGVYRVDGFVAILIAGYMIFQAVVAFPDVVNILMNAAPKDIDVEKIKARILQIKGVRDVHHIHVWQVNEHDISLECHVKAADVGLLEDIHAVLAQEFDIQHATIQIEHVCHHDHCDL